MKRDPRHWFPLALAAVGSLVIIGLLLLPKLGMGRPTEPGPRTYAADLLKPLPANWRPGRPPWMQVETLADELSTDATDLRVLRPDPSGGVCYVFADRADLARQNGLRPEEEYADCWRGLLLCVADPPPRSPDGDHGCHAGDFYLFGDLELMEKVRPVAEAVHFGAYRGTP